MGLHWEPVPCVYQNGEITGYVVRYWAQDQSETVHTRIYDASRTDVTISNLTSSTNYSFQLAATNSAGTGVLSETVAGETGL